MARQVLENGVILPAEYSDDWYDDMTSNLTKLDDVIGSDSEKLSSADVGAAALSNNYNDLDNLPTIPTVNDATLTIQKNGVDVQTFTANASSNVTANITVPTKTSDLTNDSNFVDTSNSAVASGITSAKVTDYDSHIADTDIHVTTADKNKWNNGVSQAYVFRYSSTALVASSTNSNTLLDNTDNLKVGDKVIDSDGVLFSITAIDNVNSTFTIGSALIDLALDSNVMHLSGNETVGGLKTFLKYITSDGSYMGDEYSPNTRTNLWLMSNRDTEDVSGVLFDTFRQNTAQGTGSHLLGIGIKENAVRYEGCRFAWSWNNNLNGYSFSIKPTLQGTNQAVEHNLGTSTDKWSKVFGLQYYYGSTAVEFSQKFVTTDTDQSIAGNKTFSNFISSDGSYLGNEASTNQRTNLCLRANRDTAGQSGCYVTRYRQNKAQGALAFSDQQQIGIDFLENSVRTTNLFNIVATDWTNNVPGRILINSGISNNSFGSVTRKCLINELNPGALSLPDLSNGIDISSYITDLTGVGNEYTPTVNGWICVRSGNATKISILDSATNIGNQSVSSTATYLTVMAPVVANRKVLINIMCTSLEFAYFIPCQGNV